MGRKVGFPIGFPTPRARLLHNGQRSLRTRGDQIRFKGRKGGKDPDQHPPLRRVEGERFLLREENGGANFLQLLDG
ncbi:MAG TPA: hypothetical protein VFP10_03235, partial [Candidatus Eisenbacteria bacterium]|nr:hypothetical protein [Candidatus Eisenbacteria bacterium]